MDEIFNVIIESTNGLISCFSNNDFFLYNKDTKELKCFNDDSKTTNIYDFTINGTEQIIFHNHKDIDDVLDFYSSNEWKNIYNKMINEYLQTDSLQR